MIKNVIKRDGTKEPFDAERIKQAITTAARDAEIPKERGEEVAATIVQSLLKRLEGREDVPTSEIRKGALAELQDIEPTAAQAWRTYDREHGRE